VIEPKFVIGELQSLSEPCYKSAKSVGSILRLSVRLDPCASVDSVVT